jgi:polyphosphate glucokinase
MPLRLQRDLCVRQPKNILVIDVGGTNVKVHISGRRALRKFASGPELTPALTVERVRALCREWRYEAIAIGYPGVVRRGRIVVEPRNLAKGWVDFDFAKAFGKPVRIVNDAALQAMGSYRGGRMLFLGLGTGLGSALIIDGVLEPAELGHLPYKRGHTYEHYVGERGRKRSGAKKWRKAVADVIERLARALEVDEVVIGGGNARRLKHLPERSRRVSNSKALIGGVRLWRGAAASETVRPPSAASSTRPKQWGSTPRPKRGG